MTIYIARWPMARGFPFAVGCGVTNRKRERKRTRKRSENARSCAGTAEECAFPLPIQSFVYGYVYEYVYVGDLALRGEESALQKVSVPSSLTILRKARNLEELYPPLHFKTLGALDEWVAAERLSGLSEVRAGYNAFDRICAICKELSKFLERGTSIYRNAAWRSIGAILYDLWELDDKLLCSLDEALRFFHGVLCIPEVFVGTGACGRFRVLSSSLDIFKGSRR